MSYGYKIKEINSSKGGLLGLLPLVMTAGLVMKMIDIEIKGERYYGYKIE